jgi:lauroyl/myristoyl acyltransferase
MRISKKISFDAQFRIEQVLFKTFYYFCRSVPTRVVLGIGSLIGRLAWRLKARKETALKNMKLAFKDRYADKELEGIAHNCYRHFGSEMIRIMVMDREARRPLDKWIDIEGQEILQNREKPGGVLVSGHLGCWEIANFVMPQIGEDVTVFTGKHANETADKWLNEIRHRAGTKTAGSGDDRTELFKQTKVGLVAIVGDQAPPRAPITIQFFGRPTEAAQGPALLSLLNGVDLIYFSCVKVGKRMKVRFQNIEFEKGSTRKENVQRLTQAYFDTLQAEIEQYPEQYLWMHKR